MGKGILHQRSYSGDSNEWKDKALPIFAIGLAVLAESFDTGASLGLALVYAAGLLLSYNRNKVTETHFLEFLFYTMPIVMLAQRNLLACTILCITIILWAKKTEVSHESLRVFKEAIPRMSLGLLMVLTLWMYIVEANVRVWSPNHYDYQQANNMLGTLSLTLVWIIICQQIKNKWEMVIPLLVACAVSLIIIYTPVNQWQTFFGNVVGHKNTIATIGLITLSILLFYAINSIKNKKQIPELKPWIITNCVLLLVTPSRLGSFGTIILMSIFLIAWIWYKNYSRRKRIILTIIVSGLAIGSIATVELVRNEIYKSRYSDQESYDSSTGRLKIWEIALGLSKNKITGMGSSHWAKEGTPQVVAYNNFPAENAHNSFIEIFLCYGLIGLLLFSATITTALHSIKHNRVGQILLALGIVLPMLTVSYSWAWEGTPILSIWLGLILTNKDQIMRE
jgi:O-antigen ligase